MSLGVGGDFSISSYKLFLILEQMIEDAGQLASRWCVTALGPPLRRFHASIEYTDPGVRSPPPLPRGAENGGGAAW